MKTTAFLFALPLLFTSAHTNAATIGFDDLDLTQYPVSGGNFTVDGVTFALNYNATYASWDGIALSNAGWKLPTSSNYADQFYLAGEVPSSAEANNYAVVYDPGAYGTNPVITLPDSFDMPQSFDVVNTAYTWATMRFGDSYGFSTPFAEGDWYKLTITGYDAQEEATGMVEVYLADYRSHDASKHYALTDFTKVDLSALHDSVKKIRFIISSSDTGAYGINTPTYFAFDNLVLTGSHIWTKAGEKISTWYGDVYPYQTGSGWIYSYDNVSFQYVTGAESDAWVYDAQLGWYWTSSDSYSYIYISRLGTWAYLYQGSPANADERAYYIYDNTFSTSLPNFPYATAAQLSAIDF
jgi:hypothetical protein